MKVLIVSHNSFSTYQSMGKTFCTLFSAFKKDELCQLYIYPTIPDIDYCCSFYRVTDKDVLSFFRKFKVLGKEIKTEDIDKSAHNLYENAKDESFYRNKRNKSAFRILARDFLWKVTPWFNASLKDWLRKQNITHIFVSPGKYKFIYDIALKCSSFLNVPIITYVCDEYFFIGKKKYFIEKVQDSLFKMKMFQLMRKTSAIVTISEEMKRLYEPFFKRPTNVLMTGSSFPISASPKGCDKIKELTYMGNIRCNRFESLCEIGDALDEINQKKDETVVLNIYTNEKDPVILEKLSKRQSIRMKGFVVGDVFSDVFHSSQCLLHVEAFDEKSIDYVQNSISTKIADCLGSGVLMVAYAPSNIASMKHLSRNEAAFVITQKSDLKQSLLKLFSLSINERNVIIENALNTAHTYHSTEFNGRQLYYLFDSIS